MRPHARPIEEVRMSQLSDTFVNLLLLALVLILWLVVVAGTLECSPLVGGQLCEGRVIQKGLVVLRDLLGW